MAEGSLLNNHIDEFNQVCNKLATINKALNDEGKVAWLLINSLPESYKNFFDALTYERETLSLNDVKSTLNKKRLQDKQGNLVDESGEGLIVKQKFDKKDEEKNKQGKSKNKNKTLKCFQCYKEGYFKKGSLERKIKYRN